MRSRDANECTNPVIGFIRLFAKIELITEVVSPSPSKHWAVGCAEATEACPPVTLPIILDWTMLLPRRGRTGCCFSSHWPVTRPPAPDYDHVPRRGWQPQGDSYFQAKGEVYKRFSQLSKADRDEPTDLGIDSVADVEMTSQSEHRPPEDDGD